MKLRITMKNQKFGEELQRENCKFRAVTRIWKKLADTDRYFFLTCPYVLSIHSFKINDS